MPLLENYINNFIDSINYLIENRTEYLLKIYGAKLAKANLDARQVRQDQPEYINTEIANQVIRKLEDADPTPNKQYLQWLVLRYIAGNFRLEDTGRVKQALTNFNHYKNQLQQKDINQYKGVADIEDAVEPFLEKSASKREEKKLIKSEAEKIYEDDNVLVVVPKTEEAACYYGKNTRWCTAADNNNMFNDYNKDGPLIILIDKKKNKKYQLHLQTQQFMNERDEEVPIDFFMETYPNAMQIIKQKWHDGAKRTPYSAYSFVDLFIKKQYPEFEPIIAQDAEASFDYVRNVLDFKRFPAGEAVMSKASYIATFYAENVLKGRWKSAEKSIAKNPGAALTYAKSVIKGPWPEGEDAIASSPYASYEYALEVIRRRFPKGEPNIIKSGQPTAFKYLQAIIKGPWTEAEKYWSQDPQKYSKETERYNHWINSKII